MDTTCVIHGGFRRCLPRRCLPRRCLPNHICLLLRIQISSTGTAFCLFGTPQVSELFDQLKAASVEAEYINGQEKMFGWALTKYGNVAKVSSCASAA